MLMAELKQKEVKRCAERDREVRQQKFNLQAHKRLHNPTSEQPPELGPFQGHMQWDLPCRAGRCFTGCSHMNLTQENF